MTKKELASYIDHTLLAPQAGVNEIIQLCQEAKRYNFASVCVNPIYVPAVSTELKDSNVKTCTVVGFPLGAVTTKDKINESLNAIANGADEIDMVINVGQLKSGQYEVVEADIRAVVEASQDKLVKVIIETCLLTNDEKVKACQLAVSAGADFVKTSTGFSAAGATVEDIVLMRETVGPNIGVKAAGGARSYEDAEAFIEAGATRIGTSSGVAIVSGETVTEGY